MPSSRGIISYERDVYRSLAASNLKFGPFCFTPETLELSRGGERVPIAPQPARLLELLLAHAGSLVSRETIRSHLWADDDVLEFDTALNACVRKLRQALNDSSSQPRFIETLPGLGYRAMVRPRTPARTLMITAAGLIGVVILAASITFTGGGDGAARPQISGPAPAATMPAARPVVLALEPLEIRETGLSGVSGVLAQALNARLASLAPRRLATLGEVTMSRLGHSVLDTADPTGGVGADFLVRGELMRSGDEMVLELSLSAWGERQTIWSERFIARAPDVDQSQLAEAAAWAIANQVLGGVSPGGAPDINQDLLAARYLAASTEIERLQQAATRYAAVLELTPIGQARAVALAELAEVDLKLAQYGDAHGWARALNHGLQSIHQDSRNATANYVAGYVMLYHRLEREAARDHLTVAVAEAWGVARFHSTLAGALSALGEHRSAINHAIEATRLDPVNELVEADLCWYYNFAGLHYDALAACQRALSIEPQHTWTHLGLVEAHHQLGQSDAELAQLRLATDQPLATSADQVWQSLLDANINRYRSQQAASPYQIAALATRVGDRELAMEFLRQAIADGDGFAVFAAVDSRLSALRSRSDFRELLQDHDLALAISAGRAL